MRQIIFVNEARVESAPKEYRESSPKYNKEKSNDPSEEDENIAQAYDILNKIRYNTNRIHTAPKKYRENDDPEDVKDLANKLGNSSFQSKKMQRVW